MVLGSVQEYDRVGTIVWHFLVQDEDKLGQKQYHHLAICVRMVHGKEDLAITVEGSDER